MQTPGTGVRPWGGGRGCGVIYIYIYIYIWSRSHDPDGSYCNPGLTLTYFMARSNLLPMDSKGAFFYCFLDSVVQKYS